MIFPHVCATLLMAVIPVFAAAAVQPVTSGSGLDYQAAVVRASGDGTRIVVFERLDASLNGDLWLTRSNDGGQSWSAPVLAIGSAPNERHPALVETSPGAFALFYLKGTSSASTYRIWRATSSDGINFAEQGMLDLGWATGGEVNPHVVRHADGTLTMSYQRLGSGGVYVAQSNDGGFTWDAQQTAIHANGQLPRIAYRESDGLYLASYQTGSTALQMWVKTTTNLRDWSAPAQAFAATGNNHDSLPVVLADDAFVLFWIREVAGQFDIAARRSADGANWSEDIVVTASAGENDVEPHPLVGASPGVVELYWGREMPLGSNDYDIVRDAAVVLVDALFMDGFDDTASQ
ncbi:sialidase family protein [Dokdonella sp.]|uniref:sialidase family protein n=1 Tax=Dokdonella sp. TaxID=2291710 RepID=UPI003527905B